MRRFRPQLEQCEDRITPANNPALVPPVLNSMPGAPATFYLDFNGSTDNWSPGPPAVVDTPPYDTDGNYNAYSAAEMAEMQDIWRYVAEDFTPFNINITTVAPATLTPLVSAKMAIGGDGAAFPIPGILGIAPLNTWASSATRRTGLAFSEVHTSNKSLADTISHEAAHIFGVAHQSLYAGTVLVSVYSPGPGDDTAPIMGNNDTPARIMWWHGPTPASSTTIQDDLQVIGSPTNGFGLRPDDYGNTAATATDLTTSLTGPFTRSGLIGTQNDVDYFKFTAGAGPITIAVNTNAPYNNLDVRAELRDANGALLVSSNPGGSYNASISYNATSIKATYYLVVANAGISTNATPTNYGINVGTYNIVANYKTAVETVKFMAPVRWTYDPRSQTYSGYLTFVSYQFGSNSALTATINLPNSSVQLLAPGATRVGNTVTIPLTGTITAGVPVRLFVQIKNPYNISLGGFFTGFLSKTKLS